MGFLYQHDGQRLRPEFTCPCGSKRAERVKVKRPDGSPYETEFARCYACCAMYHWPHAMPNFIPSGPGCVSYNDGQASSSAPQVSSQDYAAIMSAAHGARKHRKRR